MIANRDREFSISANVLNQEETLEVVKKTLNFISDTLKQSLGPYGSTTIVQDRYLNHTITKDGYSILKKIFIEEEESRTVLDIVKKISRSLVRSVGDGSTSSIIIANSVLNSLIESKELTKISPKDLLTVLNSYAKIIEEFILKETTPISDDFKELEYIASVSTNNDKELGIVIRDLFKLIGKYGFINIEKSRTTNTYFDNTRGFEVKRGAIVSQMLKSEDNKKVVYEAPFVLMTDGILEESDMEALSDIIGRVCLNLKRPLLIIAKGYSPQITTFFSSNLINNPNLPVVAIDIATESRKAKDSFNDLAANVGCKPYLKTMGDVIDSTDNFIERLGGCEKVIVTELYTRVINGESDQDRVKERIENINDKLYELSSAESNVEYDDEIYELRKRLACLQNSMATLFIGGATEDEKETTKYLAEDAVFACKSALEFGYIVGGNLSIPCIIEKHREEIIEKLIESLYDKVYFGDRLKEIAEDVNCLIYTAFSRSFKSVLSNCFVNNDEKVQEIFDDCIKESKIYNLKKHCYESFNETTIINSCDTDIQILRSVISIIGLLYTSNQFIKINTFKRQ